MTKEEMVFEWKWDVNSNAPKFPVWMCFDGKKGLRTFSIVASVDAILSEPMDLDKPNFDASERMIDSKGDIYKIEFDGYCIPKRIDERLTVQLLKQILDETDVDEFEQFLTFDELDSFIEEHAIH